MKYFILIFTIALLSFSNALTAKNLCNQEDDVIFSCEIKKKNVSVCQQKNSTLTYKYGSSKKTELEIKSKPYLSSIMHPGGGGAHLRFQNKEYSYIVYSFIRGIKEKTEGAGIYILKSNKLLVGLECTGFEDDIYAIKSFEGGYIEEEFKEEGFDF